MADDYINPPFCSDDLLDLMKSPEVRKAGDHVIIPALLVIANILRKIRQVGI